MRWRALAAVTAAALLLAACGPEADRAEGTQSAPVSEPVTSVAQAPEATAASAAPALNRCRYVDIDLQSRQAQDAETLAIPGLEALVAPHYAPQLDLLVGVLKGLEADSYELVVVIGPDHTGAGSGIALSGQGWDTPYGVLTGDSYAAQALLENDGIGAKENHRLLADDHAVSTHMPYLAQYLPRAQVVGMLIGRHTGLDRLTALAQALDALSTHRRVLVLLSVDFSHYQTLEDAQRYDGETIELVQGGDVLTLLSLDSRHVDSPETLSLLVLLGQLRGLEPKLEANRRNTFLDNGRPMSGSFMLWSLAR